MSKKQEMTSRERFFEAVAHREPDRVPIVLASREIAIKYSGYTFADIWADGNKYVEAQAKLIEDFKHRCRFRYLVHSGSRRGLGRAGRVSRRRRSLGSRTLFEGKKRYQETEYETQPGKRRQNALSPQCRPGSSGRGSVRMCPYSDGFRPRSEPPACCAVPANSTSICCWIPASSRNCWKP